MTDFWVFPVPVVFTFVWWKISVTVIPLRDFSHQDMGSFQLVHTIRLIMGCYVASCGETSGTLTIGELFWTGYKFALNPYFPSIVEL